MTEKELFKKAFKSINIMTPEIIEYGRINNELIYEFSYGTFLQDKLYGVTFLKHDGDEIIERCINMNELFRNDKQAALDYIESIKNANIH